MRRIRSIARATLIEILDEPFVFLTTLTALALLALAPALHYHQFGEATRMARDAGISMMLVGGAVVAVFATIRSFRREIESGTAECALALGVSRPGFFLAKALGALLAFSVYAVILAAVSLTVVNGAAIGGEIAAEKGDIARLWGPSLALAVMAAVVPVSAAAFLNRFRRVRFTFTASLLTLAVALLGALYRFDAALAARWLPVILLAAVPSAVLLTAAAAFAAAFRANAAASLTGLVALLLAPALGSYSLSDALNGGGALPWGYFAAAVGAAVPAIAFFAGLGAVLFGKGELK